MLAVLPQHFFGGEAGLHLHVVPSSLPLPVTRASLEKSGGSRCLQHPSKQILDPFKAPPGSFKCWLDIVKNLP